jgi:hypothetical protein
MVAPIKTGAHVFLEEYKLFARGDMFQINGCYIFRCVGDNTAPMEPNLHFQAFNVVHEFNDRPTKTMILSGVMDHGYDGKPWEQVLPHVKVATKS